MNQLLFQGEVEIPLVSRCYPKRKKRFAVWDTLARYRPKALSALFSNHPKFKAELHFLNIFQTFDLKGSMRSRYVQTSGLKNDVLLDENLLESE